jgi:phosphoglycolate phosphatase-like HAD superfamily hydrolase
VNSAVFLDFDGVICDSALECLASSWLAYHRLRRARAPGAMPVDLLERFLRLRPLARAAPDYVLIQELIGAGRESVSPAEFERERSARRSRLCRYARLMQEVRSGLLRTDPSYWMALHRLYPHVLRELPRWVSSNSFYILSTKRPELILRVLRHFGLLMDGRRILACTRSGKLETIARTMRRKSFRQVLFVDDQIDNLRAEPAGPNPGRGPEEMPVAKALAAWGYLRREWLVELPPGVELLYPEELAARVDPLLAD